MRCGSGSADLLGLIAMASVLVVVWMWMRNGGIQTGVSSVDGALSSLGLITGLLSSVLMILMVLALARIPLVERAWGHDQLTHRHRTLGYWSFWLMIAHVVLFAIERAIGRRLDRPLRRLHPQPVVPVRDASGR